MTCNVLATQRLLAAVEAGVPHLAAHFHLVGLYGRFATGDETAPRWLPSRPTASTKLAAEHLCRAYAANHGLPVTILRLFSVYGAPTPRYGLQHLHPLHSQSGVDHGGRPRDRQPQQHLCARLRPGPHPGLRAATPPARRDLQHRRRLRDLRHRGVAHAGRAYRADARITYGPPRPEISAAPSPTSAKRAASWATLRLPNSSTASPPRSPGSAARWSDPHLDFCPTYAKVNSVDF